MAPSTYYHLTALVNGMLTDVLVSEAEFNAEDCDPENFFPPGAKEVEEQGIVYLDTYSKHHALPEQFG